MTTTTFLAAGLAAAAVLASPRAGGAQTAPAQAEPERTTAISGYMDFHFNKPELQDARLDFHFMRFLAPVGREGATSQTATGEKVFTGVGCAACHVPALMTGPSSNPLFHNRTVPLFADLLLTTSAQATASSRNPRRRTKSVRPRSGACDCDGRCCTMAQREP